MNFEAVPLPLDTTVMDFAASRPNKFDNVVAQGQNAYENCYSGDRAYTGGDQIFRFEVDVTSRVTITLNSTFEAGLFLFDDQCTNDCIAMDETFGLRGDAQITEFLVAPGVYHIVVDLAMPHPSDWGFELTIKTDPVDNPIEEDNLNMPMNADTINVPANLLFNETELFGESIIFLAEAGNTCGNIRVNSALITNSKSKVAVGGNTGGRDKTGYNIGEQFKLRLSDVVGFVDGSFGFDEETFEERNFYSGDKGVSNLVAISTIRTDPKVAQNINMHPLDRTLKAGGGTAEYIIFSGTSPDDPDLDVDWCAVVTLEDEENSVELSPALPSNANGTGTLLLNYQPNEADLEKKITIKLSGTNIGQNISFTLTQAGKIPCEEDLMMPDIMPCPNEDIIEVSNVSNTDNLAKAIVAAAGITFRDNCTPTADIKFKLGQNPFVGKNPILVGGPAKRVQLEVTDGTFAPIREGNVNTCPIWVRIVDNGPRVTTLNLNGSIALEQEELQVFPNPNNGSFDITFNAKNKVHTELAVYNTFGQKVKNINIEAISSTESISVDMQDFNNGIYYLQLKSDGQLTSKKMVLSK